MGPDAVPPGRDRADNRGAHSISGVARLGPGATVESGSRELAAIAARLEAQYPETNAGFKAGAELLQETMVKGSRTALLMLLGAVGFVLLIASANVANLLLVRASTRETEMAVRTAMGAGRWRIVRQLVTESVLLAGAGAAVGVLMAYWAVGYVVTYGPQSLPRLSEVSVDGRVVLFAALLALITGVLFGIAPALHAAPRDVGASLKAGTRGAGGRRGAQRTRNAFVIAESAIAVVLLVGAGLFLRSLQHMVTVDPGFQPDQVSTATISLPGTTYKRDHDVGAFGDRLVERLAALPGVRGAAIGFGRPESPGAHPPDLRGRRLAAQPARRPARQLPAAGLGRLLRRARHSTIERPAVHRRGSGRRPAGRGRQPGVREALLQGPGSDRAPHRFGWGRDSTEWGAHTEVGGDIVGVVDDVKEFGPTARRCRSRISRLPRRRSATSRCWCARRPIPARSRPACVRRCASSTPKSRCSTAPP